MGQTSFGDFCSKKSSCHVHQQIHALLQIVPEDLKRELKELKKSLPFKTDRKSLATLKLDNGQSSPSGHFIKLWEVDESDDGEVRTRDKRRRLSATEILTRRRRRLTSAEVVLGRLL